MIENPTKEPDTSLTIVQQLVAQIRQQLITGDLRPGQKLSEVKLSESFNVSRNSLREAFRLLTKDGLLRHEPNRGVFVATPSMSSIIDIYRVRRIVECKALELAYPGHPAVARMRQAVEQAITAKAADDWTKVGSANMAFHAAIVDLADSSRLNAFYMQIAAELRLSFGVLVDAAFLHAPYVDLNANILALLENGQPKEAAAALEAYLIQSERTILAAFSRATENH